MRFDAAQGVHDSSIKKQESQENITGHPLINSRNILFRWSVKSFKSVLRNSVPTNTHKNVY